MYVLSQPEVDTDTVMKEHSKLTATVLDFESHIVTKHYDVHVYISIYIIERRICCWLAC